MAADDQRLETLEEEIKVLKGEVRRTLVDLRALVMREDSPLSESAYGRRAALADMASGDEMPSTRKETTEAIRHEVAEQPAGSPNTPPMAATVQQDAARAEQEKRFADQERRMAEQERKFEEQERRLAEASRPDRNEYQRSDGRDAEQERKIAEQERKIAEQERRLAEASRHDTGGKDPEQERKIAEQERKIAEQEQRLAEASRSERDNDERTRSNTVELERKIAEQEQNLANTSRAAVDKDERTGGKDTELEQKVAEQERKIAEQEQRLAEASEAERDVKEQTDAKDLERERVSAEQERKIDEQEQILAEASRDEREEKEQTDTKDVERDRMSAEEQRRPAEASRSERDKDERTRDNEAELERKFAEQDRKRVEEEQGPAETSRSGLGRYYRDNRNEASGERDKYQRAGGGKAETSGAAPDKYDGVEEDDGVISWSGRDNYDPRGHYDPRDYYDSKEEDEEEQQAPRTLLRPPIPGRGNQNPKSNEHRTAGQPERAPIVEHHYYQMMSEGDRDRTEQRPRRQKLPQTTPHNGSRAELLSDIEEENQYSRDHKERGSTVFNEYFDLMKEAEEASSQEPYAALPPLDLNLVASLVRWASIAKQRVGEQRLSYALDLYFQSGHSSPGLQALLSHVVEIADEAPPENDQIAQVCLDLIAHLHGILTGGLPIVTIPEIKVPG